MIHEGEAPHEDDHVEFLHGEVLHGDDHQRAEAPLHLGNSEHHLGNSGNHLTPPQGVQADGGTLFYVLLYV